MSTPSAPAPTAASAAPGDCWNRIGISGDRSCPELHRFIHCRNCPVFAAAARSFFDREAPDGYLADWSAQLGGPQAAASIEGTGVGVLIFRLHREWLALGTKAVVEVTPVRPVHAIPHRTNAVVSGLVNVRGRLHLCASLHGLLGVDAEGGDRGSVPRMVIIRQGDEPWVFRADEVAGVHAIAGDQMRGVPSTLGNPAISFSQAVFTWKGRSVGLLDGPRIFAGLRSQGR